MYIYIYIDINEKRKKYMYIYKGLYIVMPEANSVVLGLRLKASTGWLPAILLLLLLLLYIYIY